jgi:protein-S-isoprenylcysteine O-methyltransferase Ste14
MKRKPEKKANSPGLLIPQWAVPMVWAVIMLGIQVFLPWILSKFGPWLGWEDSTPGALNLAGLILIALGLALYVWCLALHFKTYSASVRLRFSPPHLVGGGPYRFSRNPMYLSGLAAWLGWTIFYGSPAVLLGVILIWAIFAVRVIPAEERQLEELFGDKYLSYKRAVRRWVGRR